MTARVPPRIASWLLGHLGSDYHGEALAGDLFEEYQRGKSLLWYWRQALAAIVVGRLRGVRTALSRFAANAILRLLTEASAMIGIAVVAQQAHNICSIRAMLTPTFDIALIAVIALAASIGFYLTLCDPPGRARRRQKPTRVTRLVAAFAMMTLSVGTLTWASSNAPCAAPTQDGRLK